MKTNFFVPIVNENTLLEKVDNYFYFGGKKAFVIKGKNTAILLEGKCSLIEKIGKIVSYCFLIIPIFLLIAKAALRYKHQFVFIDPKKEVEKDMSISQKTLKKINELIPKIIKREDDDAIEWISKDNTLTFKLKDSPNIIYKMVSRNYSMIVKGKTLDSKDLRDIIFSNLVKAKEVCLVNELDLLIVPSAKKVDVKFNDETYALIAEENIKCDSIKTQEKMYQKYSPELNEAVRQLATLVAKTGLIISNWSNIPVIYNKIAIPKPQYFTNAIEGFNGDQSNRGLLHCVSEEQIDIVISEAKKHGIAISGYQAKARRAEEINSNDKLKALHRKNGVKNGNEPLRVDINSLDLDLNEKAEIEILVGIINGKNKFEKQTFTLKEVLEAVINEINKCIYNNSDKETIKDKRHFVLNIYGNTLFDYRNIGNLDGKSYNSRWIYRIIQALINKGYIFELEKEDGHGLHIQA